MEAARTSGANLTIDFAEIPSPDPRKERRKLPHRAVWTYRSPGAAGLFGGLEQQARPGAEPPPDPIVRAIAAIAAAAFDRDTWSREARALGERLGPQAVESLLASMVHPAAMPAGMTPWAWRFRVQVAAAFTLLGVDRGWGGSARERGLSTLLYGPVDWATTAALVAMTEVARMEPEHRKPVVAALVEELALPINPVRYACIVAPLLGLLPALPLDADARARVDRIRSQSSP
jgi:hypothetical protein